jgi:uncharacterized protein (TIGR03435 family)
LKEVIKYAFGVREEAIVGAPAWVDSERYDIVGRAAPVGSGNLLAFDAPWC